MFWPSCAMHRNSADAVFFFIFWGGDRHRDCTIIYYKKEIYYVQTQIHEKDHGPVFAQLIVFF